MEPHHGGTSANYKPDICFDDNYCLYSTESQPIRSRGGGKGGKCYHSNAPRSLTFSEGGHQGLELVWMCYCTVLYTVCREKENYLANHS